MPTSFTLGVGPFPVGTTVGVYARQTVMGPAGPVGGVVLTSAVTGTDSQTTFTGLEYGTDYWAAALVGDGWRSVSFRSEDYPGDELVTRSELDAVAAGRVTAAPYSADPTGTTDATAAIQAAVDAGSATLQDGTYRIDGVVTIPYGSDLIGTGAGKVTLRLGAAGQIRKGDRVTSPSMPGGRTVGFTIDGNNVSNVAGGCLYVGNVAYHSVKDVKVKNGAGDGVVIEGAQNSNFDIFSASHGGHAFVVDYGAGGNHFRYEAALAGAGKYNLVIRQSAAASNASQYPATYGPCDNTFEGLVEFSAAAVAGLVYIGGGRDNRFRGGGIGSNTLAVATPLVTMELGALVSVCEATFIDTILNGTDEQSTHFQLDNYCQLVLLGRCKLYTGEVAFRTRATSILRIDPRTEIAFIDTLWQQVAGDTPATTFASLLAPGDLPLKSLRNVGETGEAAAFGTAWQSYGGGYLPARYYRDGAGVVHLEGYVKNTAAKTADSTIFGLPAGYRPVGNVISDALVATGQVTVQPDGQVAWFRSGGVDLPINSLTGIAMQFMPV